MHGSLTRGPADLVPPLGQAGRRGGRASRWAAGGPRAVIPGSCRFPQIDSLLTFFFPCCWFRGSDRWSRLPRPSKFPLSWLLISAPINQPPTLASGGGANACSPSGFKLFHGPAEHKRLLLSSPPPRGTDASPFLPVIQPHVCFPRSRQRLPRGSPSPLHQSIHPPKSP